ncbi:MAG: ATP-dependent zinc metalloprotease FtsH [Clostridia bacterium]|nr:ATP-dependent zinc metalloprotease FtsH [Clostridia bacterium]
MKKGLTTFLIYVVALGLIIYLATTLFGTGEDDKLTYGEVISIIEAGEKDGNKISKIKITESNVLVISYADEKVAETEYSLRDWRVFYEEVNEVLKANPELKYDIEAPTTLPWWVSFLPYVLVILIMVVLWWSFISKPVSKDGSGGGMGGLGGRMNSFSKARTKLGSDEKNKVFFKDVAGADEEKEELQEIVDFLKNPSKYTDIGAKIPKGVLLIGAPGTGKTLLAKAVAGEAGVPFYSISGSDFVEMYVGVGASRVRDLFETAKKTSPSIIFIDEIDAVGRHRGAGWGGGHDEREQTLNQLLVEMDGFGGNAELIVMAATNRPDILDPALLRPGRFDRQITVNYPDLKGRLEILKVHARNKKFEPGVDFEALAKSTVGFTGADLANLLNEAALLAARSGKRLIGNSDLEDATLKVIVGPQKKSRTIKESEKKKTAYHEAGHAIVGHFLPTQDPVRQISIIPSGRALGYTLQVPEEDRYSVYKTEMKENIAMLLGGRVAEKVFFGDISGGASNDIQRATDIARKMVTQLGMSDTLGPIVFGSGHDEVFLGKDFSSTRNFSEKIAAQIDDEIHSIISEGYSTAEKIITEHTEEMHFIAEYLVANEVMDSDQFLAVFEEDRSFEKLDAIRDNKVKRSEEANRKTKTEEINDSDDDVDGETEEIIKH